MISLLWRTCLTHLLLKKYFDKNMFYTLGLSSDIDNPDQRICAGRVTLLSFGSYCFPAIQVHVKFADVAGFTERSVSIVMAAVGKTVSAFSFVLVLFNPSTRIGR
jgi:ABC-type uncharacterized transport system fused permease/ATPase subunit